MEVRSKRWLHCGVWDLAVIFAMLVARPAFAAMPVEQQNSLIQKYCAVCHNDAHVNGGLSLQHYDAGQSDPALAVMLLSKIRDGGAIFAAGVPKPDDATVDALSSALSTEAAGSNEWSVAQKHPQPNLTTASIVRELAAVTGAPKRYAGDHGAPDLYRLILTCNAETLEGGMLLTWAPGVPANGTELAASADGRPLGTYKIEEGFEKKVFKGAVGTMGTGAVILDSNALPERSVTVTDFFGRGPVAFPFDSLDGAALQGLSPCFRASRSSR